MAFYCWWCYGRNDNGTGPCVQCGRDIRPPDSATQTQRLIWGTHHPDPDVAIICTRRLGTHADTAAVPLLRALIMDPPDPYVGAEALTSLLALSSVDAERQLLQELADHGPVLQKHLAQRALTRSA